MNKILKMYLIFLVLQHFEAKKRSRSVYYLETTYDMNEKYFKNLQINISDDKTSMDILFETSDDITDIWASVGISLWQKSSNANRSLFSYDIDLCDTLQRVKTSKIQLLNVWISNFLKYGNMSSTCPFRKNVYYFENLRAERDSIPSFAPMGKFRTSVVFYRKKKDDSKEVMGNTGMTFELK